MVQDRKIGNAHGVAAGWRGMTHDLLGFFLLFTRFEEMDANLIAIDPASSQRRYAFPIVESTRKNSFVVRPPTEPSIVNLAPVSDTSSIVQGRRQVPSIAIMLAENPRSNTTRFALRCSIQINRRIER